MTTSQLLDRAAALDEEAKAARDVMEKAISEEEGAQDRLAAAQQACFPRTFAPLLWHFDFLEVCNAALTDRRLLEAAKPGQRGANGLPVSAGSRVAKPQYAPFVVVCMEVVQTLTTASVVSPLVLVEAITWRERGATLLLAVGYDEELVPQGSRRSGAKGPGRGPSKAELARMEADEQLAQNRGDIDEEEWDATAAVNDDNDEEAELRALRMRAWEAAEALPVSDAKPAKPADAMKDDDDDDDEEEKDVAGGSGGLGPAWTKEDDKSLADEHGSLGGIESAVSTLAQTLQFPSGATRSETAIRNRCIQLGLEPEPTTGIFVKIVGGRKTAPKKKKAVSRGKGKGKGGKKTGGNRLRGRKRKRSAMESSDEEDEDEAGIEGGEGRGHRWPRRSAGALVEQEAVEDGGDPSGRLRRAVGKELERVGHRGIVGARSNPEEARSSFCALLSLSLAVVRQALVTVREAAAARREHLVEMAAALGLDAEDVGKLPAACLRGGLGLGVGPGGAGEAGELRLPVFVPSRQDSELKLLVDDGALVQILSTAGISAGRSSGSGSGGSAAGAAWSEPGAGPSVWSVDAGSEGCLKKLVAVESELSGALDRVHRVAAQAKASAAEAEPRGEAAGSSEEEDEPSHQERMEGTLTGAA